MFVVTLFVVFVALVAAGSWWSVVVLTDEDRYVKAIEPLAGSVLFARLAGYSVGWSARRRTRRFPLMGTRLASFLEAVTRRSMRTRSFRRFWPIANRLAHRERHAGHMPGSPLKAAGAMVFLATMGTALNMSRRLTAATGHLRVERLRTGRLRVERLRTERLRTGRLRAGRRW